MRMAGAGNGLDPLRPQRPAGLGRGAVLALLVHGGLLLALALGVRWRASEPTGATAELWAAVPAFAAPAAAVPIPQPSPPPQPVQPSAKPEPRPEAQPSRDAEIAIEKAKREREKEREREAKAEAEKKRQQALQEEQRKKSVERAEFDRLEKLRQDTLKRMLGQAGATGHPAATGTAARDAGPSASYAGKIMARVLPNIVLPDEVPKGTRAEVEVRTAPDGAIVGRRLVKSSGNKAWDEAVLRALDRTETLPRDVDGRVPPTIPIGFTR
ncbi:MAG: cell envelope integrity protein TolA [Burkholderiaceae bacterium]|nr:cell envelope integrity protein TolA [Burkholderiaceae bacterium]